MKLQHNNKSGETVPMNKAWWKESVVYQIYPRSFFDSNGDGVGDLRGIIKKLDYIVHLGIDVLWICPFFQSPNADNGYDISNYRAIAPELGNMQDCEDLLYEAHCRGLKVMMDLVVNHTSDEHAWFIESKQSAESPMRDYYIWRDGKDGAPPNNWMSLFGGSAWKLDEATNQYYLHLFTEKQPDLNWDNDSVRRNVYDMMEYWINKGFDGFRMDMISLISKAPGLPDGPLMPNGYGMPFPYVNNGPRVHEYLQEMNSKVISRHNLITVGETAAVTIEDALAYANHEGTELNMVFQFDHMQLDMVHPGQHYHKPNPKRLKQVLSQWQTGLHGKAWNSLYWCNHDQPRAVSRFGNDSNTMLRERSAKMLALCLHCMQGTPYVFQGEELGMTNILFDSIDEVNDVESINQYRRNVQAGATEDEALWLLYHQGRENARTPMQWSAEPNAGFTNGTPWLKVNPNYREINVEEQLENPQSVFHFYRRLIRLRRQHPIMVHGSYTLLNTDREGLFIYRRDYENKQLLVICNMTEEDTCWAVPDEYTGMLREPLISNEPIHIGGESVELKAYFAGAYLLY